jgi:hypothetical protein
MTTILISFFRKLTGIRTARREIVLHIDRSHEIILALRHR